MPRIGYSWHFYFTEGILRDLIEPTNLLFYPYQPSMKSAEMDRCS